MYKLKNVKPAGATIPNINIKLSLLGEVLGAYHKIETIKTLNIYISVHQAIIRSYV